VLRRLAIGPGTLLDRPPEVGVARRLSRDQRQMLIVAFGAVVVAVVFVIAAIVATGDAQDDAPPAVDDADYVPFPAGEYDTIVGSIRDEGPVQFPDLLGGTRSFSLDLLDGDLVALRLLAPDSTDDDPCGVQLGDDRHGYVDCRGAAVDPHDLDQFPLVFSGDDGGGDVSVDVRRVIDDTATTTVPVATDPTA
jgi:hypothetical protein